MTSVPIAPERAPDARVHEAARQLEGMLLRQLLRSTGAFKGGGAPGAGIREDLFADALADAVTRAGGLGLAETLARSITGAGGAPAPTPGPTHEVATALPAPLAASRLGTAPVAGAVTSRFGARADPFTGAPARHDGVDVAAPEGTPILAPAAGTVRSAGARGGYGNAVELDHGGGLVTLYAHASEVAVVPGQAVSAGEEIARVGSTGRSTGPHLHFEVRVGGRPVDPARALKIYASRAEGIDGAGPRGGRSP